MSRWDEQVGRAGGASMHLPQCTWPTHKGLRRYHCRTFTNDSRDPLSAYSRTSAGKPLASDSDPSGCRVMPTSSTTLGERPKKNWPKHTARDDTKSQSLHRPSQVYLMHGSTQGVVRLPTAMEESSQTEGMQGSSHTEGMQGRQRTCAAASWLNNFTTVLSLA
jgi:hypothetical protein